MIYHGNNMAKAKRAKQTTKTDINSQYDKIYLNAGIEQTYKTYIEVNGRHIYFRTNSSYTHRESVSSVLHFINKELAIKMYEETINKIKNKYHDIEHDGVLFSVRHLNQSEITDIFKIKKFKDSKKPRKYIAIIKDE